LYNVGIITKLLVKVTATVSTVGGGTPAFTQDGPFNLLKRVRLTDFDGTDRVNVNGAELWQINNQRRGTLSGYNNEAATAVLTQAATPPAGGASQTYSFFMEVPVAFDPDTDLRGAILAQTSVGEISLNLDIASSIFSTTQDDDNLFFQATTTSMTLDALNVDVYQDYLLPQNVNGQIALPELDLLTVYELAGALKSSDNLAVSSEKLINIPNVRSVIGVYLKYKNGPVQATSTTDISRLRLIANGNNVIYERNADAQLFEQRTRLNSDTRKGWLSIPFRRKPLETALYGNVQVGLTPTVVGASAYVGFAFESFYTKGSTLPGLSQASG